MMISERHRRILEELERSPDITVKELAKILCVSEPTVRRDFTELHNRGMITKIYGGAILNSGSVDKDIPFLIRENEKSSVKAIIGAKASELIQDGMVIMLDGSTSAYHLVPHISKFKDIIAVTSGAKTAVALAEANVKTFCTGGQMRIHSFSYIGKQAEEFVENINADILFFSCHGLSEDGRMTDIAIEEANLRKAIFRSCKKKVLLCDSSKFGKTCFYNMGTVKDIDVIITEGEIPEDILEIMNMG